MDEKSITPDTMMKTYWSGNEEFADFYNAVLFGLENQTYICYPMSMRTMGYDHTAYHRKYTDNARKRTKDKTLNRHEYLSGMKRTDRFPAVITVVVYYGLDPWDGPVTLRDMLDIPQEYAPFVQDYSMQLVEVRCCHLKLHNQNNIHLFDMLRFALNQDLTWQQARNQVLEYADAHHPEKIVLMTLSSIIDRKIDFRRNSKMFCKYHTYRTFRVFFLYIKHFLII